MTKRLNSKFRVCKKIKGIQKNLWGVEKASKFRSVKVLKSNLFFVNQKLKRLSTFKKLLNTKQCLKHFYCNLHEKAFQLLIKKAIKSKSKTMNKLISLLESRIDIVLYRACFVNSLHMARQLINHGYVLINTRRVSSITLLKSGDIVSLNTKNILVKKQFVENLKNGKLKAYYKLGNLSQDKDNQFKKILISTLNKKNRNFTTRLKKMLEKNKKLYYSQKYKKLSLIPSNLEVNFKLWKIIFLWDPMSTSVYYPLKLQYKKHRKGIVYGYNEILYND